MLVELGRHDFSKSTEGGISMYSRETYIHPCRIPGEFRYDIAMIKLPLKIDFNLSGPFVQPICLPDRCDPIVAHDTSTADGCHTVEMAGWGRRHENGKFVNLYIETLFNFWNLDQGSSVLQRATVTLQTREVCDGYYYSGVHSEYICTTGQAKTCEGRNQPNISFINHGEFPGDSGSALMCRNRDLTLSLLGVTAFGGEKCNEGYPVFSRYFYKKHCLVAQSFF